MNLLSRLTAVTAGLLLPAVALTGTAYAKLPPDDPNRPGFAPAGDPVAPVVDPAAPVSPVGPVVETTGLSPWQVIALVLIAAIVTAVLTVIATRRMPRFHPPYAKSTA
jgi:hypothetical protein